MPYESINPYDGKLLESFKEHTDKELEAAVSTAAICFTMWRHQSFAERPLRRRNARVHLVVREAKIVLRNRLPLADALLLDLVEEFDIHGGD